MRKKSHISLARFIVKESEDSELKKHKMAFYLGSILPDCKPSFLYKKHEMTGTFSDLKKRIEALSNGKQKGLPERKSSYYRSLGQVTHYLADYFTYPHNKIFPGTMKDHCVYEENLKLGLRKYLKDQEMLTKELAKKRRDFRDTEAMYEFIQKTHEDYLKKKLNVEEDMKHIVEVNHYVVLGIDEIYHKAKKRFHAS